MSEFLSPEDKKIVPVFNEAVNYQMTIHIGGEAKGADLNKLDDQEFTELVMNSERQPLKPLAIARDMLGYDETATAADIMSGLHNEHMALKSLYLSNGIDPTQALDDSADIIDLTESYIAGYSRMIGGFAQRVEMTEPGANGLRRWNDKIWVPEEDGHDRSLGLDRLARDRGGDRFDNDHVRLMQIGVHPVLDSIPAAMSYPDLQEGATDPSYSNRSALLGPNLGQLPKLIGKQEVYHFRMYGGVLKKVMDADPDRTLLAFEKEVKNFDMPGREGIRDYEKREKAAALTGLLDPASILDVQRKTIKRLGVSERNFATEEAKRAQHELTNPDGSYGDAALAKKQRQLDLIRERKVNIAVKAGGLMPAILGVTVVAHPVTGELTFPYNK